MNFDVAYTNNTAPRDQFEELKGWPLSRGGTGFPSGASKPYLAYNFSCPDGAPSEGGSSDIMLAGFRAQDWQEEGQPTSLTREEREADTSYAMLASRRSAMSTASVDGRIQEPHLNDILCGRGGSINSHPGNRVFRGWIAERRESYNLAESKADKSRITSEIMERVRDQGPPGRFLQKIVEGDRKNDPYNISGYWHEIDGSKALAKISQALREGAPAFRALHGKPPKANHGTPSKTKRRSSARRKHKKAKGNYELSPGERRKAPPEPEEAASPVDMQEVELTPPPLPATSPLSAGGGGHELDVLFPKSNNVFATENYQANGNLLNSYPLVHMGDYTASIDEVAGAIPPTPTMPRTPITVGNPREGTPPPEAEMPEPGVCATPSFPLTPNGNMVSPGFSPGFTRYGEAKAAWDAIAFLPNLSERSPVPQRQTLQRVHSLSFSDGDVNSIGSFNNPFENDNGKDGRDAADGPPAEVDPRPLPPRGLSFGRIGDVPGGGPNHCDDGRHCDGRRNHRGTPRHRPTSRRESSISSKSWGSSVSNLHNSKRKSIA